MRGRKSSSKKAPTPPPPNYRRIHPGGVVPPADRMLNESVGVAAVAGIWRCRNRPITGGGTNGPTPHGSRLHPPARGRSQPCRLRGDQPTPPPQRRRPFRQPSTTHPECAVQGRPQVDDLVVRACHGHCALNDSHFISYMSEGGLGFFSRVRKDASWVLICGSPAA